MESLSLMAEVTGTVAKIAVRAGQTVETDDPILIVESMKMEIPVCATAQGIVLEILVAEGEAVEEGQVVALLQATP